MTTLTGNFFSAYAESPPENALLPIHRELRVPIEDLPILLNEKTERIFLTRDEYNELKEKVKKHPQTNPPQPVALVAADYQGKISQGRLLLQGKFTVEVLSSGYQEIPLELAGVYLQSVRENGNDATLAFVDGRAILLLDEPGRHSFDVELSAPVTTMAAQQSVQLRLPSVAASTIHFDVSGNVETKIWSDRVETSRRCAGKRHTL